MGNHSRPDTTIWTWIRDFRDRRAIRRVIMEYKRRGVVRCICDEMTDDDIQLGVTCPVHPDSYS